MRAIQRSYGWQRATRGRARRLPDRRPSSARTRTWPCCARRSRARAAPCALHVAGEPPGALSTVRFLERAHRLGTVEHPNLLGRLRHAHARRPRGRGRRGPDGHAAGRAPRPRPDGAGAGGPGRAPGRLRRRRARGGRSLPAAADRRAHLGRRRRRRPPRRPRRPPRRRARPPRPPRPRSPACSATCSPRVPASWRRSSRAPSTAPTCPPASSPRSCSASRRRRPPPPRRGAHDHCLGHIGARDCAARHTGLTFAAISRCFDEVKGPCPAAGPAVTT